MMLLMYCIVCPLVFLAGLVDAVGGGGGLISLPAYIAAGLPPHMAVATNKLSATFGTALVTFRFIRNRLIDFRLALPAVFSALIGAFCGSNLSMVVSGRIITILLYIILPITAFFVINPRLFHDNPEPAGSSAGQTVIAVFSAFIIGMYDGFYGPGTGTFLLIAFTVFAKLPIVKANGLTKAINLTTNVTSLVVFLIHGQVLIPLGLTAAACNMAGGWLGAGLAMKGGIRIIRPVTVAVLILLLIKISGIF